MSALETLKEAHRLKLGIAEALTAAAIGKLGRCYAGEIRKEIGVSYPTVNGRLRGLIKKGVVRKIDGRTVYDHATYELTKKASAWKEGA